MDDIASKMKSDAYIREAIVQLLSLKLRAGTTVESLADFTNTCVNRAGRRRIPPDGNNGLDIHRLGSVLRSWHTEARFLAQDGSPRPLKMTGRNSLQTLIRIHYPAKLQQRVTSRLKETKLIKHHNKGWLPTERHARISQPSLEILEHLSEGIARYVETVTKNISVRSQDEVLFERSCKVTRLPVKESKRFREFVAEQATVFISAIDDWLERRNVGQTTKTKTTVAGVYTFAYLGKQN